MKTLFPLVAVPLLLAVFLFAGRLARPARHRAQRRRALPWLLLSGALLLAWIALTRWTAPGEHAASAPGPFDLRPPRSPDPRSSGMSPPHSPAPDDLWPAQPDAAWPPLCVIENVAVHPWQPWLTAACTHADSAASTGAVVLFDATTGRVRASTHFDSYVGWLENSDLLRWHPDGQRLATNVSTNGIAVLRRGQIVGSAFPDDTRDSGVGYVWMGDQIFTDTGVLLEIRDGDELFPKPGEVHFTDLQWNPAIRAVVGRFEDGIGAFDPVRKQLVYRVPGVKQFRNNSWSADGRRYAASDHREPKASNRILLYNGDDGRLQGVVTASLSQVRSLFWSHDGALALVSYAATRTDTVAMHVDIVRNGVLAQTLDLGERRIDASDGIPEAEGVAWSPTGQQLALLLDRQEVQIRDAATGQIRKTFAAPAPAVPKGLLARFPRPAGSSTGTQGALLWIGPDRLVRLAPHFVSFWSTDGQKIGEILIGDD